MDILINNPDNIPWWLVFDIMETVADQHPDFKKIAPYKAKFGREGRVYELELKSESNAVITKAAKER